MWTFDFEPGPLVLAMILGPPLEASLRRSLIYSRGNFAVSLQHPIALILLGLAAVMLFAPLIRWALSKKFWQIMGPVEELPK